MPYIIETRFYPRSMYGRVGGLGKVTRHAVATLDEARDEAAYRIERITGGDPDYEEVYTDAQGCSELGDTFGPLPDGTVIEVRQVGWDELRDSATREQRDRGMTAAETIDAYNAAQESGT